MGEREAGLKFHPRQLQCFLFQVLCGYIALCLFSSGRFEISQLLLRLWLREDCRQSILKECGGPKFQPFLGAIFDTLLYQLNDGLSRLVNVRQHEIAKDSEQLSHSFLSLLLRKISVSFRPLFSPPPTSLLFPPPFIFLLLLSSPPLAEGQWSSLPPNQRREKEVFLASEKRASRGFISQANNQMELLDTFSEMEPVAQCLCRPPLARRTAAAVSTCTCTCMCSIHISMCNIMHSSRK